MSFFTLFVSFEDGTNIVPIIWNCLLKNHFSINWQPLIMVREIFFKNFNQFENHLGDESKKLPDIEALAENFSLVKENQKAAYFLRAAYEMIL